MPHVTLRYSDNLKNTNFEPFFQRAHEILCEKLNVKAESCSSMAYSHQQYLISEKLNALVHLDILVKSGKNPASLMEASQTLAHELKNFLKGQSLVQTKASVNIFETSYFSS